MGAERRLVGADELNHAFGAERRNFGAVGVV
jgi:hypothetical protein